jgi:hypothetical protein
MHYRIAHISPFLLGDQKMKKSNFPWALIVLGLVVVVLWFNGGQELLSSVINPPPLFGAPAPTPTITPQYQPPPPEATKNSPEGDYFGKHIKTAVPTEELWRISVADLFSLDRVMMNQYFNESVYQESQAKIEIGTYVRARASEMYTAMTWPDTFWTRLMGVDGEVVSGSELSTITAADVLLSTGTTPGHALAGISEVTIDDNTVYITSNITMQALLVAIPISEENNNPQIEHSTKATPKPWIDAWLGFSERLPSESTLNNLGARVATKEALWLLLHQDGESMWSDFKTSVETPSTDGTHAYDILVPYIEKAFCQKLEDFQNQLEAEGKKLDRVTCEQMKFEVTLIAVPPTNPQTGQMDIAHLTMVRTGNFVQTPDPDYFVQP